LGHWSTKKILKKCHTGELHKKGTILHQAPQITLFFYSLCTKNFWKMFEWICWE